MEKKKQLTEQAYEYLRDQIIFCDLAPGAPINEDQVAQAIGSSRTPVREAILRLERENYVSISPRKGTFVSKISLRDVDEIIQIRSMLEPQILRDCCLNLAPEDLDRLRRMRESITGFAHGQQNFDDKRFLLADYELHMYLVSLSRNQHLIDYISSLILKSVRFWFVLINNTASRIQETCEEHLRLIDAVLERDGEKAAALMDKHILICKKWSHIIE